MRHFLFLAAVLVACVVALGSSAQQQLPVRTLPSWAVSVDASGSISSSNTFQQIAAMAAVTTPRTGCLIINNSTHRQWVYFGVMANATEATAIPLEAATANSALGGSVSCATATGAVLQDQISITGTSGDTFVAKLQ